MDASGDGDADEVLYRSCGNENVDIADDGSVVDADCDSSAPLPSPSLSSPGGSGGEGESESGSTIDSDGRIVGVADGDIPDASGVAEGTGVSGTTMVALGIAPSPFVMEVTVAMTVIVVVVVISTISIAVTVAVAVAIVVAVTVTVTVTATVLGTTTISGCRRSLAAVVTTTTADGAGRGSRCFGCGSEKEDCDDVRIWRSFTTALESGPNVHKKSPLWLPVPVRCSDCCLCRWWWCWSLLTAVLERDWTVSRGVDVEDVTLLTSENTAPSQGMDAADRSNAVMVSAPPLASYRKLSAYDAGK